MDRLPPGSPQPIRSLEMLGTRVDDVTFAQVLAVCGELVRRGERALISTVNPEIVMAARRDPSYRRVLNSSTLCVPDGVGLLLAARLSGCPLREHVRGTDLVEKLAEVGVAAGYRFFFLGGRQGAGAAAAAALSARWPGLQVAGCHEGDPEPAHDDDTVAAVREARPVDILLVAYGAPAQERWIHRNLEATGAIIAIGVGGVFDMLSGRVPRAPIWMRKLELEWLYRLARQPWRWKRQLALPAFALLIVGSLLARRPAVTRLDSRSTLGSEGHEREGDHRQQGEPVELLDPHQHQRQDPEQ